MAKAVDHGSHPISMRSLVITVYVLFLLAMVSWVTAVVGVILAYACRRDAGGTAYISHFNNAIEIFWVFLAVWIFLALIAIFGFSYFIYTDAVLRFVPFGSPFRFATLGGVLMAALDIWMLIRLGRGLIRILADRHYA